MLIYFLADQATTRLLRFEPSLRWEAWRWLTYNLVHWGGLHLALNVGVQCAVTYVLEVEQGGTRVGAVYMGGAVGGALGACVLQPQPMVGASAGIYAVLISHLAHIYLVSNTYYRYRGTEEVSLLPPPDFYTETCLTVFSSP